MRPGTPIAMRNWDRSRRSRSSSPASIPAIRANSDNVLRGGLTPKHVDIDELLAVLEFTPTCPTPIPCIEESQGLFSYQAPAKEFALWRIDQGGGSRGRLPG